MAERKSKRIRERAEQEGARKKAKTSATEDASKKCTGCEQRPVYGCRNWCKVCLDDKLGGIYCWYVGCENERVEVSRWCEEHVKGSTCNHPAGCDIPETVGSHGIWGRRGQWTCRHHIEQCEDCDVDVAIGDRTCAQHRPDNEVIPNLMCEESGCGKKRQSPHQHCTEHLPELAHLAQAYGAF